MRPPTVADAHGNLVAAAARKARTSTFKGDIRGLQTAASRAFELLSAHPPARISLEDAGIRHR